MNLPLDKTSHDRILIDAQPLYLQFGRQLLLGPVLLLPDFSDGLAADIALISAFPNDHGQPSNYVKDQYFGLAISSFHEIIMLKMIKILLIVKKGAVL